MQNTLSKLVKTDLLGILTLTLINGYSFLVGTIHGYSKTSSTISNLVIHEYIDNITKVLGEGLQVLTIAYIITTLGYVLLNLGIPTVSDLILLKFTPDRKITLILIHITSNIPCIIISLFLLEPIILLLNAGLVNFVLNLVLTIIACAIIFIIKTLFIIGFILKRRRVKTNGSNEFKIK